MGSGLGIRVQQAPASREGEAVVEAGDWVRDSKEDHWPEVVAVVDLAGVQRLVVEVVGD